MKFYTLDGNEIDRAEFVRKYGNSYYIDRPRCIPRVGQSSRTIEDYMDELLKNGVKEPLDVVRILAWKLGRVKMGLCMQKTGKMPSDLRRTAITGRLTSARFRNTLQII